MARIDNIHAIWTDAARTEVKRFLVNARTPGAVPSLLKNNDDAVTSRWSYGVLTLERVRVLEATLQTRGYSLRYTLDGLIVAISNATHARELDGKVLDHDGPGYLVVRPASIPPTSGRARFGLPYVPRGAGRAAAASFDQGSAMNKELFDKGLAIRKSVIGAEFVDKALASADDFNMPLQELVTEYCWGAVWGREGLEKKTRSLLNIAMLSTLNRPHELKVHVKGAIRNGATKAEIREVLLQVAIYAGVPAAVDSFRIAKEALGELDKK
jgi:4-carboxymuconolactone decarboxylase